MQVRHDPSSFPSLKQPIVIRRWSMSSAHMSLISLSLAPHRSCTCITQVWFRNWHELEQSGSWPTLKGIADYHKALFRHPVRVLSWYKRHLKKPMHVLQQDGNVISTHRIHRRIRLVYLGSLAVIATNLSRSSSGVTGKVRQGMWGEGVKAYYCVHRPGHKRKF